MKKIRIIKLLSELLWVVALIIIFGLFLLLLFVGLQLLMFLFIITTTPITIIWAILPVKFYKKPFIQWVGYGLTGIWCLMLLLGIVMLSYTKINPPYSYGDLMGMTAKDFDETFYGFTMIWSAIWLAISSLIIIRKIRKALKEIKEATHE